MDIISRGITEFILFVGEQTRIFWNNLILLNYSWQQIVLDIFLVSILFYYIFSLLKGTRAVHIITGLIIIALIFAISQAFDLVTLRWLIDRFLTVALISIPIIFQKELRMGLERLGHTKIFLRHKARQRDLMIISIVKACESLAKDSVGALIVVQNTVPLKEFIETGVDLNAKVSRELLESIFRPKSPLHDGAVIIADEHIKAASCILPHSSEVKTSELGTRHKAGLGLSENTDAGVVIVSEEKGTISFAYNGKLEKGIKPAQLQLSLTELLKPKRKRK